jgi:hypothetical protein
MKKSSCGAILALLLAVLCVSCQKDDLVSPYATTLQTETMVIGRWKIDKIDYKVCRKGDCSTTNYSGSTKDYFEFKADSAFLSYNTADNYQQLDAFKADYSFTRAFILKKEFWSAKYIIKECKDERLVLECSYMGNDPYATFTDTYYLYR